MAVATTPLSDDEAHATLQAILRGLTKPSVAVQSSMPQPRQRMLVAAVRLSKSTDADAIVKTITTHRRCKKLHGSIEPELLDRSVREYLDELAQ